MTRTIYEAQWYGEDSIDPELANFDPTQISRSQHDSLDDAKRAAFKGASRHMIQGICYVKTLVLDNDGLVTSRTFLVNECWRNKWSGWKASE
jgi:hypothetical protein